MGRNSLARVIARPSFICLLRAIISVSFLLLWPFDAIAQAQTATSLRGKSNDELLQIMTGGKEERRLKEEAQVKTHLPDRFWEMTPKDAALALVAENCPTELRNKLRFSFDAKQDQQPSARGEIGLRWECSHCVIERGLTVLHYAGTESVLNVSRVELLGHYPSAKDAVIQRAVDQTKKIPLPQETARQLYETIWWLCHIRAVEAAQDKESSEATAEGIISTGDGRATFWVSPYLRRTNVTLYTDPISDRYANGINNDLFATFAELLLNETLAKQGVDLNAITSSVGRDPLSNPERRFVRQSHAPDPNDAEASRRWITRMLEILRSPKDVAGIDVIERLVPRTQPIRYEDKRIDLALIDIVKRAARAPRTSKQRPSFHLMWDAASAAEALAWRDRTEVFPMLMELLNRQEDDSHREDIAEAAARIASKHPEVRPAMIDWLNAQFAASRTPFEETWRGDFRELVPELEQAATSSPDEVELSLSSDAAVHHFHRARAILTAWHETDALTKLKLDAILDASTCCYFRLPEFMYAEYAKLGAEDQKQFREFVEWLGKQPAESGIWTTESLEGLINSNREPGSTN